MRVSISSVRLLSYVTGLLALGAVPARAAAQADPDSATIAQALALFDRSCALPAARVWGPSLCGPIVLVRRQTGAAFGNRPDPAGAFVKRAGVYIGAYPAGLPVANTSMSWRGERWATVVLPLPAERFDQLALLAHEAFHRLQDSLRWGGRDAEAPHLASREGRLWWRMELRALEYALTTSGEASRAHTTAALHFRHHRQSAFPGSDALEDALEFHEGVAEYTGQRVASAASPLGVLKTIDFMRSIERRPSLVRGFAYATGPALGFLLDRFEPRWHARIRGRRSLSALLKNAIGASDDRTETAAVVAMAGPYGYERISAEEAARELQSLAVLATYRSSLVDGPVLRLRQESMRRSFDPNTLIPLDSLGTIYPTGTFSAEWGTLEVTTGGALVSPDFRELSVPLSSRDTGPVLRGNGWVLRLADGWEARPDSRPGDLTVSRKA